MNRRLLIRMCDDFHEWPTLLVHRPKGVRWRRIGPMTDRPRGSRYLEWEYKQSLRGAK